MLNDEIDETVCDHCRRHCCEDGRCVLQHDCDGRNDASPSHWTAYQILVHSRCVPAYERALEEWDAMVEAELAKQAAIDALVRGAA